MSMTVTVSQTGLAQKPISVLLILTSFVFLHRLFVLLVQLFHQQAQHQKPSSIFHLPSSRLSFYQSHSILSYPRASSDFDSPLPSAAFHLEFARRNLPHLHSNKNKAATRFSFAHRNSHQLTPIHYPIPSNNMSAKLDQSLDEILSGSRRVAGKGGRRGRRAPAAGRTAGPVAPVGGVKKTTRSASSQIVPTGPAGRGDSRIQVSGLVSTSHQLLLNHNTNAFQPKDVSEAQIKVCYVR
jgi:hypothetical protein